MKILFIKALGGLLYVFAVLAALIFLSAWTFHYWQAWTFLFAFMVCTSAISVYLAINDPALLARRTKTTETANNQRTIRLLVNLTFTFVIVISVLDHRFRWSAMPPRVALVGDAVVILGLVIIFLVFRENTFSGQTVEVEAGQRVIATGPYALVRHPMYAGGLVFILGIPLALGSLWGLASIVFFAPVAAWRILDEENLLAKDLPGYAEYEERVKYRLLPHIW
jgi:protein-S-isoprenylcysteine O-methyltransferase Ste14